jgi:hypothetical protein
LFLSFLNSQFSILHSLNRMPPRRKAHASDTTAVIRAFLFAATALMEMSLVPAVRSLLDCAEFASGEAE